MNRIRHLRKRCLSVVLGIIFTLGSGVLYELYVLPMSKPIAVSAENWGLSFPKEGEPPNGMTSPDELRSYNAYFVGDTTKPVIYITFDAGFENGNTKAILEALKKHNAPACFFLVGNYLESEPDLVKQMISDGHLIGNHTMHHPDMSAISNIEDFQKELSSLESLYSEITGQEMPRIYRPPQGKYSTENLRQAQELGYATFFWSLAYVDWYTDNQPTPEQAFSKLIPRIHNGAIVLLHSTSTTNAEILDELLSRWENAGYSFGKLTDLLDHTSEDSENTAA